MLQGRSAVVTGSTSGIGFGIARALARAGANVLLHGFGAARDIEPIPPSLVAHFGAGVVLSDADLRRPAEVRDMIAQATRAFGAVDILVNSAGMRHSAPLEKLPAGRWHDILAVNLSSSFHAIKAVMPQMRHRNWGRIVNVAAVPAPVGSLHDAAGDTLRHAMLGLTRVVALDTATTGVTANAICPDGCGTAPAHRRGAVITERKRMSGDACEKLPRGKQPSLASVAAEEIGELVVLLCSEAAAHIRGACLQVDGAWLAQQASTPHAGQRDWRMTCLERSAGLDGASGVGSLPIAGMLEEDIARLVSGRDARSDAR